MNTKKFIPCIYLYQKQALEGPDKGRSGLGIDPVELAGFYADNGADELIVFDLSEGDKEHEEALDIIKAICHTSEVPVTGTGNIHRPEDVKKLLYAGCKQAALDFSIPSNVDMAKEVSQRFGKEKIASCVESAAYISCNRELLETYVSRLILVKETILKECVGCSGVPFIAMLPEMTLNKLLDTLNYIDLCGVTGVFVNKNAREITALKSLCAENGIHDIFQQEQTGPLAERGDERPFPVCKESDGRL